MLRFIISLIILTVSSGIVFPQSGKFLPSQVKIGTDLSYIGASILSKEKTQREYNADIDFNRFIVTMDYGTGTWNINDPDFDYDNSGTYFRMGVDYNFTKPSADNNAIYIGARYAISGFTENFTYRVDDPFYGAYEHQLNGIDRNGSWIEFVTGMKVRIWKGLFLGWTGRLKFASSVSSGPATFNTYWMPGFGKTNKDSQWGLNYQIYYRIPLFRKKFKPEEILEAPEE